MKPNPFTIWTKSLPPARRPALMYFTITIGKAEFDAVGQPCTSPPAKPDISMKIYTRPNMPERISLQRNVPVRIRK